MPDTGLVKMSKKHGQKAMWALVGAGVVGGFMYMAQQNAPVAHSTGATEQTPAVSETEYLKSAFYASTNSLIASNDDGGAFYLMPPSPETLIPYIVTVDADGHPVEFKPYLSTNGTVIGGWMPPVEAAPSNPKVDSSPLLQKLAAQYELTEYPTNDVLEVWQVNEKDKVLGFVFRDPANPDFAVMHSFSAPHLDPQEMLKGLQGNGDYQATRLESELTGIAFKKTGEDQIYTAYAFPTAPGRLISGVMVNADMALMTAAQLARAGLLVSDNVDAGALPASSPQMASATPAAMTMPLPVPQEWLDNPDEAAKQMGSSAIKNMTSLDLDTQIWQAIGKVPNIRMGNPGKSPLRVVVSTGCAYCAKMLLQLMPYIKRGDVYIEAVVVGPQADHIYAAPNAVEALYQLYFGRIGNRSFRPDWTSNAAAREAVAAGNKIIDWIAKQEGEVATPLIMYHDRKTGELVRSKGLPEDLGTRLGLDA